SELRELTGIDNGYLRCGGIEFLPTEDHDLPRQWEREGFPFERVTGEWLRVHEPAALPIGDEAYHLPTCAQVRNPWHLRALAAACVRLGVRLRPQEPVAGWLIRARRVAGIRLANDETIVADRFVLAAGAWSESLLDPLGLHLGIHPVRG